MRRIRRRIFRARRSGRRWLRRLFRFLLFGVLGVAVFCVLWVTAYRWINPPITYLIAAEWVRIGDISRDWRDLEEMGSHIPLAVVAAEDARFCAHWGLDVDAIRQALSETHRRRGASTISQQVAKNVFLWPDANWARKGLELGFTVLIEGIWPKARILEVYLNVAEFGPGVFGVEAGARRAFDRGAEDLTPRQAALLAAILPAPKSRNPASPTPWLSRRAASIADGAATLRRRGDAECATTP